MTSHSGALPERGAVELLQDLYARRATGALTLRSGDREEHLYLLGGQLYLSPEDVDAEAAAAMDGGPEARRERLASLVARLTSWAEGEYELREGTGEIGSEARGPLPTAELIMTAATEGLDDFQLLRRLGGEEAFYRARPNGGAEAEPAELDPGEAFLLSRMDRPVQVDRLLEQKDQPRREVLRRLCRLLAVGLIEPADDSVEELEAAVATPELLATFESRVAESLGREPLELERDEHREQLRDLIQRLGEMHYYQLLGVEITATPEEIHDAYLDLARRVHPSHAAEIGLAGREAAMGLLFERATVAYLTLSDSERTRAYLSQLGEGVGDLVSGPSAEVRSEEQREVSERNYRMARTMADREEYHFAIELLHQAVRTEPQAKYYALLGECQTRNPNWMSKAIFSFQRAVELDPDNADLRLALGRAYERAGNRGRARFHYREALERKPDHLEAMEAAHRLRLSSASGRKSTGGPLRRFLRWLRG